MVMKISIVAKRDLRKTVLLYSLMVLLTILFINGNALAEEKASPAKETSKEAVVVEVNGVKFVQKELDEKIERTIASVQGMVPPEQLEQFKTNLKDKLVEDFVTRTLISEQIEKNKITVDESEVANAMKEVEAKTPPGMTLEQMLEQGGITVEELKENINFSLRANKLFETAVQTDYVPTDTEIQEYFDKNKKKFDKAETVHARHILIKVDEKDDDTAKAEKKKKVEGLRKQLIEGAEFEKLAKENSECPSKEKGGDLGTFPRGRMVKPFEDAAFSQKINEVGPVIETKFGYHIIQVLEHNEAESKSLAEVKTTITETLQNQKKQEVAKSYIDGLKEKAKIVYPSSDSAKK
jgi:peptidyl-prolyl cis-trans isomerase C